MLWVFAEIIAKPGVTPGQGLHRKSSSSFISIAHSGPEGGNQLQEKKPPFNHGAPGRIRGAHFPVCPSAGWSGVTAKRTYQHPLIINSSNTTEILLRADFLPLREAGGPGGLPWSSHIAQSASVVKTRPPTGSTRPRNTGPPTPSGAGLDSSSHSLQVGGQANRAEDRGKCPVEETQCRAGSDHTLGPPLRLRAEIVPAGAQGSTPSHSPPPHRLCHTQNVSQNTQGCFRPPRSRKGNQKPRQLPLRSPGAEEYHPPTE